MDSDIQPLSKNTLAVKQICPTVLLDETVCRVKIQRLIACFSPGAAVDIVLPI